MYHELLAWLFAPRKRTLKIAPEVARGAVIPLDEMVQHLDAILALSGLDRVKATRTLPATFFKELKAALAAYDRFLDVVVERKPLDVQCHAGCSHCCCDAPTGRNP